jgi:hypothetical protein
MKCGRVLTGLLFLALLALVQAARVQSYASGTRSNSDSRSRSSFSNESEVRVDTLDVRPAMTRTSLDVRATLSEGSVTLVLTDPNGTVQWEEETVAPARYNEPIKHDLTTGEWTVDVVLRDATGSHDIRWQGSD